MFAFPDITCRMRLTFIHRTLPSRWLRSTPLTAPEPSRRLLHALWTLTTNPKRAELLLPPLWLLSQLPKQPRHNHPGP
jgi:hypothetical protein